MKGQAFIDTTPCRWRRLLEFVITLCFIGFTFKQISSFVIGRDSQPNPKVCEEDFVLLLVVVVMI